ncbi:hypothetical protein IWQ56_004398 [Coemansia nantahalensis]|nr:hypothetical protein IWQ56_004398 [Coemansia nantahalensis]
MRLSLLAVAALCVTALGATVPLAVREPQSEPSCETCGITEEDISDQAQILSILRYEQTVSGLMRAVSQISKALGGDVSVDMVKGYMIAKSGERDDYGRSSAMYDLINDSGECIIETAEKGNACSTPEKNNR